MLRGTETYTQTGMVERLQRLQGTETDMRKLWLQGLQRLQDTETDRQTGTVARVAKVARYKERYTDRYGCKGCKVQRLINRQV